MSEISEQREIASPTFSVVLPTYNRAEWLSGAIESVIEQQFQDWELLVVDDGSTDSTKEVVGRFKDERVRYLYQTNAERSAARNRGMTQARGDYITFLDSDDRYTPKHLEELQNSISSSGSAVFVSCAGIIDGEGNRVGTKKLDQYDNPVRTILFNAIGTSQICIPAHITDSIRFDVALRINEDTDFMIRCMEFLPLIVVRCESVQYTVHDDNSVSLGGDMNVYKERLHSLENLLALESCQTLSREERDALLSNCYFGIAKHHALRGESFATRKTLLSSLLRFPTHRQKEKLYALFFPSVLIAPTSDIE